MSKEGKQDKSFPEKFRRFFKLGGGAAPGNREIRLTEELRAELGPESPTPVRLKAIRELNDLLTAKKLEENGTEKLWLLIQDLLGPTSPAEHHYTCLTMLTTLTAGHDRLGHMRHIFYNYIAENYQHEDVQPLFDFFCEVVAYGKQLEYIEELAGPFLLIWLPTILTSPQASDALNLLVNLVKFNAAYLEETVVTGYVKQVVLQLHSARNAREALLCLKVLDAVLAYSYLPSPALPTFITALTRAVNVPQLTSETWKIMRNLLGTHLGNSGLYVLCRLIQSNGDPSMVRGAIFFLTSALWGTTRVTSLNYKPAAVLPTLQQAAKQNHVLVVYEVTLSVKKLVNKLSLELHLSSWDLIISTLSDLFEHTVKMKEGMEKQAILGELKEIVDVIEQLVELHQFGGSTDKFYSLVDKYSYLHGETSVMHLLDYQAKSLDPLHPHWLAKLGTLLSRYYCKDSRPSIRNKALAILSDVYSDNKYLHGIDIVRNVISIQMEGIEKERDVGVRTAAVNLLVQIVLTQKSRVVLDIFPMLDKIVMAPFRTDLHQTLTEGQAADIVAGVVGLVKIFRRKLFELPSEYCFQAYAILINFLGHHYRYPHILEAVPTPRIVMLEMIFDLRANSKYQLGFPNKTMEELIDCDEISNVLSSYSPYVIVDHKHGLFTYEFKNMCDSFYTDTYAFPREDCEEIWRDGPSISPVDNNSAPKVEVKALSLTQAAMAVIVALKKEKDWNALNLILERVPQILQNKTLTLSREGNNIDYFAANLCALVTEKALELPESLLNAPAKLTKADFQALVFPVLGNLASYHLYLEPVVQQKVIKCLQFGVLSRHAGPMCVSALTLCVLEMRDTMVKLLREVMLNLSKMTATLQNAQPILEFLSTILHLPKVYSSFVSNQYMSIFAIAIPYTNPFKFNHFIVSLAYHVIAMWFLKCRLSFRKHFVPFISKNLNMILANEEAATRMRSGSVNEQALLLARARMTRSVSVSHKELKELEELGKTKGKADMIQFHNELRETCVDLMSRYTFASCAPLPKRGTVAEMFVSGGQCQTWLVGNKLVTVTTSGCSQKPLKFGLCPKCAHYCNLDKDCPPTNEPPTVANRRRHRSEFHRTISHETAFLPRSKDDLHMRQTRGSGDNLSSIGDQSDTISWDLDSLENTCNPYHAASSSSSFCGTTSSLVGTERHLCACWCQGWAEILIRQATGNMSWMMRVQNHQTLLQTEGEELPLHDLSILFAPPYTLKELTETTEEISDLSGSVFTHHRIDAETQEEEIEGLLTEEFEDTRPRAFSGASDRTQDSDAGSQKDSSGWSSEAPSHTSSDPRINSAELGDDTRGSSPITTSTSGENPEDPRVPVQRCHSSPEMSEGVVVEGGGGGEEGSVHIPPSPLATVEDTEVANTLKAETSHDATHISNVAKPKPKPRFESPSGTASVGSTSPPPAVSTRMRHTSAFQTKSVGSGSVSPSSGLVGSGSADGEDDGSPRPMRRGRGHTISDMNPASRKLQAVRGAIAGAKEKRKDGKGGISPSFVFLQLFYHGNLGAGQERPILVPTKQPELQRALRVLDLMKPQETHKIGVLYVGPGQTTEQEILRNDTGTYRYVLFLQGLGTCLELSRLSDTEVFLGGLDRKGADGKLVYVWEDDVMQVVYHIATLMPNKETDPNCSDKKRHIGNNFVTIVYNNSGKTYDINTLKGQFNHTIIEIIPEDHNTNSVRLKCRPDLEEFVGGSGSIRRIVSDTNLPILVRQQALHANLASMIWESLTRPPHTPFASNWLERLRKIRKIRQTVLNDNPSPPASDLFDFTDMIELEKLEKVRGNAAGNLNFLS